MSESQNPGPQAFRSQWAALSKEQKKAMLSDVLKTYTGADDAEVADVSHGVRVTVELHKDRAVGEEGRLLMDVERFLRGEVGVPLELYFRQLKDQNKLRQNRKRMADWLRRRALAKAKANKGE